MAMPEARAIRRFSVCIRLVASLPCSAELCAKPIDVSPPTEGAGRCCRPAAPFWCRRPRAGSACLLCWLKSLDLDAIILGIMIHSSPRLVAIADPCAESNHTNSYRRILGMTAGGATGSAAFRLLKWPVSSASRSRHSNSPDQAGRCEICHGRLHPVLRAGPT